MPPATVAGIAAICHQVGAAPTDVMIRAATATPNAITAIVPAITAPRIRGGRIHPRRRTSAPATVSRSRSRSPASLPGVSSATRSPGRGRSPNTAARTPARKGVAPVPSMYSRASSSSAEGSSTMRRCPATAVSRTAAGRAPRERPTRCAPSSTSTSAGGAYSGTMMPRPAASRLRRREEIAAPIAAAVTPRVPSEIADSAGAASTENCSAAVRTTSPGTNVPRAKPTEMVRFSPGPRSSAAAENVRPPSARSARTTSHRSVEPCSPR